jgi:HK97 family phage major capsid protein
MAYTMMEVYAQPKTTQRLLDMAIIDIGAWLADEVDITFAQKENDAFINGDGVKKPRGFLTYDKVANASWAWGKIGYVPSGAAGAFLTPTTSVSPEDAFYDLVYAMKQMYRAGGSFLMADTTQGAVRKLKDVEGKSLWAPPTAPEGVPTIVGKPVETDDFMPAIAANSYSIAFADWKKAYTVVERPGVQVIRDAITEKGFVKFYTRKYVGGGLGHYEPIKLMKFAVS